MRLARCRSETRDLRPVYELRRDVPKPWTGAFNPKVAGSIPARPIRQSPANSDFPTLQGIADARGGNESGNAHTFATSSHRPRQWLANLDVVHLPLFLRALFACPTTERACLPARLRNRRSGGFARYLVRIVTVRAATVPATWTPGREQEPEVMSMRKRRSRPDCTQSQSRKAGPRWAQSTM